MRNDEIDPVKWSSPVAAIFVLIFYGCWTRRIPITPSEWDFTDEVFLRLAILIALAVVGTLVARNIWRASSIAKADWWNIGGRMDDPTWEDVRRMTLGKLDDPINCIPKGSTFNDFVKSVAAYVIVGCLFIEISSFIVVRPIIPRLFFDPSEREALAGKKLELNANLTAFLALIAAAISIHFTHRQLQAKVKADSRQAWIDKLRGHIAIFIALAESYGGGNKRARGEMTRRRLEMELMLNPSEKDHRLLMYLSIRMAFFGAGEEEFRKIHDVINVRAAIEGEIKDGDRDKWTEILDPIPNRKDPKFMDKFGDLVGYTMRLSHVVLKREWQRVKSTR